MIWILRHPAILKVPNYILESTFKLRISSLHIHTFCRTVVNSEMADHSSISILQIYS